MAASADSAHVRTDDADLRALIGHREAIQADDILDNAYRRFSQHTFEYMAVLDGTRMIGLVGRSQIGMLFGAESGRALFLKRRVREYMLAEFMAVTTASNVAAVLDAVFRRNPRFFYDDVALLADDGAFLGLIFVYTLVQLQNALLSENIRRLRQTNEEIDQQKQEMETDLSLARELQMAMLPQRYPMRQGLDPVSGSSLSLVHRYRPAGKVGGDFFQVLRLSESTVGVFVCDVMGHGVRAAMVTAMLRALLEELKRVAGVPGEFLTQVNRDLQAMLRQSGSPQFATVFYLVADLAADCFRFACAGHPPPLRSNRADAAVERLRGEQDTTHPPLGLLEDVAYRTHEAPMRPGDRVILFTDGITEATNNAQEEFGEQRLMELVRRHADLPAPALLDRAIEEARLFAADGTFTDDVCLVALEVAPAASETGASAPDLAASRQA
ncbi:MAG: SpoIIE family protein phosphatase [Kiritimatiellae bacterium]|nr:SpoIIE family protein phosphatase [Kiritimatiellia bacterium]